MKTIFPHNRVQRERRDRRIRFSLFFLVAVFILLVGRGFLAGTLIRFVARPVWYFEDMAIGVLEPLFNPLVSRVNLERDVRNYAERVSALEAELLSRNTALTAFLEYQRLFPEDTAGIPAMVLSRPPRASYDTLIVNAGKRSGVVAGDRVFVSPHVAVGTVNEVFETSSRVTLFSSAEVTTEAFMDNEVGSMLLVGNGGGVMEAEISRAFVVASGTPVTLSDRTILVGYVDYTRGSETDPFQRVFVALPVNIQNLSWVTLRHVE